MADTIIQLGQPDRCSHAGNSPRRLLECLERPDFFNGQHLTDEDLDAIVEWTRGRLRLSRLREGWGVVCGLHLSVDTSGRNQHQPVLRVSTGYAVDSCGEDIVACEELTYPIWQECRDCSTSVRPTAAWDTLQEVLHSKTRAKDVAKPQAEITSSMRERRVRAVDLFLVSDQTAEHHELVRHRSETNGGSRCQNARWREAGALVVREAVDPYAKACNNSVIKLNDCLGVIDEFVAYNSAATHSSADIRRWFLNRIDAQGSTDMDGGSRLPFLKCTIEHELSDFDFKFEWLQALILHYLVADCRIAATRKCCPSGTDEGVRLARIWLSGTRDCCSVCDWSVESPWRREFRADEWPAPWDKVNLAQVYWMKACDAKAALSKQGFNPVQLRRFETFNLNELKQELTVTATDLCVDLPKSQLTDDDGVFNCNAALSPVTLAFDPLFERIVDFGPAVAIAANVADVEGDVATDEKSDAERQIGETESKEANDPTSASADTDVPRQETDENPSGSSDSTKPVSGAGEEKAHVSEEKNHERRIEVFEQLLKDDAKFPQLTPTRLFFLMAVGVDSIQELADGEIDILFEEMQAVRVKLTGKEDGSLKQGSVNKWIEGAKAIEEEETTVPKDDSE